MFSFLSSGFWFSWLVTPLLYLADAAFVQRWETNWNYGKTDLLQQYRWLTFIDHNILHRRQKHSEAAIQWQNQCSLICINSHYLDDCIPYIMS